MTFTTNIEISDFDTTIQTACFRVAQEAITNVIRHARAKALTIDVHGEAGELCLKLRDDGIGFDPAKIHERATQGASLGLLGMQERVLLAGGTLEVHSKPGQGTQIRARFPLASAENCAEKERS